MKMEIGSFPKDWDVHPIINFVPEDRGISYGVVQPGHYMASGVPIIRVNNIRNGRVVEEDVLKIDPQIEKNYRRTRLTGGELLISLVGNLGEIATVGDLHKGWNVARAVGVIPLKKNINSLWVKYWLGSKYVRHYISTRANTTVQATLNLKDVEQIPVLCPSLKEQDTIVKIVSPLDDKIDLLRRQNETLEQIAQTLFKRWFVEFEFPYDFARGKPDPDGQPYKSSGGKMTPSELGEIPKGWRVGKLGEICTIMNGFAFKSEDYVSDGYKIIRTKNFGENGLIKLNDLVYVTTKKAKQYEKFNLRQFDFLLVMVGASIGKNVIVTSNVPPALQNQNMWNFRSKNFAFQFYLIEMTREIVRRNMRSATGSAREFFRKDYFYSIDVLIPTLKIVANFNSYIIPLYKKIDSNISTIMNLTKVRDSLLPKLMSGQIRVGQENRTESNDNDRQK